MLDNDALITNLCGERTVEDLLLFQLEKLKGRVRFRALSRKGGTQNVYCGHALFKYEILKR